MRPVLGAAAAALAGGSVLLGCGGEGGDDAVTSEAELAATLREDHDMPAEQADCVAGQDLDRLTDDELDLPRQRDADDELPPELERKLRSALTPCASIR